MKQNQGPLQAAGPAGSSNSHMGHQPSAFVELADTSLVVEGTQLSVHSAILAANSRVFAEMFSEAKGQQQYLTQQLEVQLPGDTFIDVYTALEYLYKGCTIWLASDFKISGFSDAMSLAKFAHKYEIVPLLQACEAYLVQRLQNMAFDVIGIQLSPACSNIDAIARIIDLAETCNMKKLLAHCEFVMIKTGDRDLWSHPAMLSDAVSRHSLLRMLRAFQAGLNQEVIRPQTGWGESQRRVTEENQHRKDTAIATLMAWNEL